MHNNNVPPVKKYDNITFLLSNCTFSGCSISMSTSILSEKDEQNAASISSEQEEQIATSIAKQKQPRGC